jgi:hypothetical protein
MEMSRILAIMLLAAGMTGGAAAANAEYRPDYAGYYGPRYIEGDRYIAEQRAAYYDYRRPVYHRRRRRYYDSYDAPAPRYYEGYDDYYLDDLPERRGYYDGYADDPVYQEEPGTARRRDRGFDPRRPHLGDGTDAPSEQFYPRRPRSCGEYYYWDGTACVDARKYPPYVGPKR